MPSLPYAAASADLSVLQPRDRQVSCGVPTWTGPAVVVDSLVKTFKGGVRALDGVSFEIPAGTVLGLLGPNGAGKTTAVRVLTTLLRPDSGRAVVAGIDVLANPARARTVIGLAGQYAAVDEGLTGMENLVLVGRLNHLPRAERRATGRRAAGAVRPDRRRPTAS